MITPSSMAIMAITVMLWIVWSDTIRARRPTPILYAVRIALYVIVSGVMIVNMIRHPHSFAGGGRVLTFVAIAVGFVGAFYFGRKLVRRA